MNELAMRKLYFAFTIQLNIFKGYEALVCIGQPSLFELTYWNHYKRMDKKYPNYIYKIYKNTYMYTVL